MKKNNSNSLAGKIRPWLPIIREVIEIIKAFLDL